MLGSLEDNMPDEDDVDEDGAVGHEDLDKAVDDLILSLQNEHL